MNFLAHIYLSGEDRELMIGNFIADAVKGSHYKKYPYRIKQGILLHRAIDHFTDTHPTVKQSIKRLRPKYGLYSGIIVDIFYDHFLAANWKNYSDQPLAEYVAQFYKILQAHAAILPERILNFMPYMLKDNWLLSYATIPGISRILDQMNHRTKGRSKMTFASSELEAYYLDFQKEFEFFFIELKAFSEVKTKELLAL